MRTMMFNLSQMRIQSLKSHNSTEPYRLKERSVSLKRDIGPGLDVWMATNNHVALQADPASLLPCTSTQLPDHLLNVCSRIQLAPSRTLTWSICCLLQYGPFPTPIISSQVLQKLLHWKLNMGRNLQLCLILPFRIFPIQNQTQCLDQMGRKVLCLMQAGFISHVRITPTARTWYI